jgi:outer membrane protein assembly factor BamB/tRNA A-37 threonylcarbamoyl transferase component Bud32
MALIKKAGPHKGTNAASAPQDEGDTNALGTATPGTRRTVAPTMQPGVILQGRYAIEGTLGIGGMSVVYRGRDLRFKDVVRPCAIKEMYQSAPDSQTRLLNLKNFERESGLLATLQHPAIPKVYDFFEENGRIYLILELVPGKDLETVLDEAGGPLPEERVVRWAVQICDVLEYLHNHQPEPIVFRDMKPSNVMVTPDDRIVLIDFGIARNLTRADRKGTMIGTEGYSPPEQYRGLAEPQGDLYALGATLHHLLTGSDPRLETPFTFHERPLRQLNPHVSPELEAVVTRALEYDMTARWSSAAEMRAALLQTPTFTNQPAAPGARSAGPAPARARAASTELVWSFTCEDEVRSSPCVSNGMVFIGCYDTNLYALDAERGVFRWKYATEGGIASSPTVWQDLVIVGSEDGAVYALDMRRGTLRWSFRTAKPVRSSPRVEDRVIFFGSDDQHFYALDGLRGTLIWKHRSWMPIRSSACIANDSVFVGGNDGHIYCFDIRTGAVRWKQRTQQPVISSPAFGEGLVFVGSMDNNVYALDSQGGWPAWRFRTGHYVNSSPCVVGTRVFVGGVDGNMYALEAKNGRLAWKFETGSQITSSPRVEGGRVYFGAVDGFVYCLDAGTGALIWKFETNGPVVSSPAVQDGVVYIGSMDHQVYALRA